MSDDKRLGPDPQAEKEMDEARRAILEEIARAVKQERVRPWKDLGLPYEAATHGMQSGVALEMNRRSQPTEPKHLRVGINASMSDHAGLVWLLVVKGIITEAEYIEAIRQSMNNELALYEERYGVKFR